MEEIGCHFKFENIIGNVYHDTNLLLSSGRNCLRYIIREKGIVTLFLPYFLCESLSEISIQENIEIKYYHIDSNYMPTDINESQLNEKTYIYFVNYYGLFRNKINYLIDKYKYIIIDNTHDFFNKEHYNADVIYNYRACIVSDNLEYNFDYSKGKSLDKVLEMLSRDETGEFFHYPTFLEADKHFRNEDLKYMSNFTENYLHAISYEQILKKRLENYMQLCLAFEKYNSLNLSNIELTYMFPLFVSDGKELREYLKANNIYSLKLWPNIDCNGANTNEILAADNMVLIPIDQRYSFDEMEYIIKTVNNYYSNKYTKKLFRGK